MREVRNLWAKTDFRQIWNIFAKIKCERQFQQ